MDSEGVESDASLKIDFNGNYIYEDQSFTQISASSSITTPVTPGKEKINDQSAEALDFQKCVPASKSSKKSKRESNDGKSELHLQQRDPTPPPLPSKSKSRSRESRPQSRSSAPSIKNADKVGGFSHSKIPRLNSDINHSNRTVKEECVKVEKEVEKAQVSSPVVLEEDSKEREDEQLSHVQQTFPIPKEASAGPSEQPSSVMEAESVQDEQPSQAQQTSPIPKDARAGPSEQSSSVMEAESVQDEQLSHAQKTSPIPKETSASPSEQSSTVMETEPGLYEDSDTALLLRPSTASKVIASLGAALETTYDILSYIVPTGKLQISEQEMDACEDDFPITLMRVFGVPKYVRHSIYTEACGEVDVLFDLGSGACDAFATVLQWICGGSRGRDHFIKTTRALCSIHTEVDLDSEVWKKVEHEVETAMGAGFMGDTAVHYVKTGSGTPRNPSAVAFTSNMSLELDDSNVKEFIVIDSHPRKTQSAISESSEANAPSSNGDQNPVHVDDSGTFFLDVDSAYHQSQILQPSCTVTDQNGNLCMINYMDCDVVCQGPSTPVQLTGSMMMIPSPIMPAPSLQHGLISYPYPNPMCSQDEMYPQSNLVIPTMSGAFSGAETGSEPFTPSDSEMFVPVNCHCPPPSILSELNIVDVVGHCEDKYEATPTSAPTEDHGQKKPQMVKSSLFKGTNGSSSKSKTDLKVTFLEDHELFFDASKPGIDFIEEQEQEEEANALKYAPPQDILDPVLPQKKSAKTIMPFWDGPRITDPSLFVNPPVDRDVDFKEIPESSEPLPEPPVNSETNFNPKEHVQKVIQDLKQLEQVADMMTGSKKKSKNSSKIAKPSKAEEGDHPKERELEQNTSSSDKFGTLRREDTNLSKGNPSSEELLADPKPAANAGKFRGLPPRRNITSSSLDTEAKPEEVQQRCTTAMQRKKNLENGKTAQEILTYALLAQRPGNGVTVTRNSSNEALPKRNTLRHDAKAPKPKPRSRSPMPAMTAAPGLTESATTFSLFHQPKGVKTSAGSIEQSGSFYDNDSNWLHQSRSPLTSSDHPEAMIIPPSVQASTSSNPKKSKKVVGSSKSKKGSSKARSPASRPISSASSASTLSTATKGALQRIRDLTDLSTAESRVPSNYTIYSGKTKARLLPVTPKFVTKSNAKSFQEPAPAVSKRNSSTSQKSQGSKTTGSARPKESSKQKSSFSRVSDSPSPSLSGKRPSLVKECMKMMANNSNATPKTNPSKTNPYLSRTSQQKTSVSAKCKPTSMKK